MLDTGDATTSFAIGSNDSHPARTTLAAVSLSDSLKDVTKALRTLENKFDTSSIKQSFSQQLTWINFTSGNCSVAVSIFYKHVYKTVFLSLHVWGRCEEVHVHASSRQTNSAAVGNLCIKIDGGIIKFISIVDDTM